MSSPSSEPSQDSEAISSSRFTTQTEMGLAEVLQMGCSGRRSGQITFRSEESYGFIFIQQGNVLHAVCGVNEGEEAIYLMLSWPGGSYTLDEGILPHKRTISHSWEQLLIEGARRADMGMLRPNLGPSTPVTTADPQTSAATESQARLTIALPDGENDIVQLECEFTHVGRMAGNEVVLPFPSVSSRHCVFVLSGPDVLIRDLNSSNGTYVNGEPIAEALLRPGDVIDIGVVRIRFEPGMRRPKLSTSSQTASLTGTTALPRATPIEAIAILAGKTAKLPKAPRIDRPPPDTVVSDNVFVGGRAIKLEHLQQPPPQKTFLVLKVGLAIIVVLALAGAYYHYIGLHLPKL